MPNARDPGSLDQHSTDWATEAVAVSLGTSSVYIPVVMPVTLEFTLLEKNLFCSQ